MNRRTMMTTLAGGVVAVGYADRAKAATLVDGKLPVASADAAKDLPGAKELHEAGVELRVCGQGLMGKKVDPSQLLPGVQADLWAMVTMVNLQSRGYVRVG